MDHLEALVAEQQRANEAEASLRLHAEVLMVCVCSVWVWLVREGGLKFKPMEERSMPLHVCYIL